MHRYRISLDKVPPLNNLPPWIVPPFLKKHSTEKRNIIQIASLDNVPGHYLKKYGIWSTYCELWLEWCLNYRMKRLLRGKKTEFPEVFWIKEYFLLICDLIFVDIPKLKEQLKMSDIINGCPPPKNHATGCSVAFLGDFLIMKWGQNMKKLFCCPALELFSFLPPLLCFLLRWKTVRVPEIYI